MPSERYSVACLGPGALVVRADVSVRSAFGSAVRWGVARACGVNLYFGISS